MWPVIAFFVLVRPELPLVIFPRYISGFSFRDGNQLSSEIVCLYGKGGINFSSWEKGYVHKLDDHLVNMFNPVHHREKPIRAAFECIRLPPKVSVLQELDPIDFAYVLSYSLVEKNLDIEECGPSPNSTLPETAPNHGHRGAKIDQPEQAKKDGANQIAMKHLELSDED